MRSLVFVAAFAGSVICPVGAMAQNAGIPAGSSVYLEDTGGFGADIELELQRQKVLLKIVLSKDEAQFLIVNAETKETSISKVEGGISFRVRRTGVLSLQDKATNTVLWSDKWELRSYDPKDQRKAASDLVGKLKKVVRAVPRG